MTESRHYRSLLLASTAAILTANGFVSAPAMAMATDDAVAAAPAGDAGDVLDKSDIVVLGKSYGREIGKTMTPLKDVPNTVTVVERDQIEAQNLFTLEDALTATNGITVTGVGSEDPSFLSRGFAINNYLIDGVPSLAFGFPGTVPDLFFYDRIEVLRGPAGLFSGAGNPAGSINLVRKRPLDTTKLQASAGYGSYNNLRFELDGSTRLNQAIGIRAGAFIQDQDQFFDVAHRRRWGGYGVASVNIGSRTTLTFGGFYDNFRPAIQSGLPGLIGGADGSDGQLLKIRRSTYLGAEWNRFTSESKQGFVEMAHHVSDRWTLRATGLVANVDRTDKYSYIGNQPVTAASGVTSHIAYFGDNKQRTRSFDFNAIGSFPLFGRNQTLILGIDYQGLDYRSLYSRLSNYARIDVYNPVYPAEPPLDPLQALPAYQGVAGLVTQNRGGTRTYVEQYGIYGQTRLSPLAGITLVGGGRITWWDTRVDTLIVNSGALPGRTAYGFDGRFTPYAGLVWDVTHDLNVYGSYADSFTPQTSALPRFDGKPVEPLIGEQFEAGLKWSPMHNRVLLSAALYQITQSNRLFSDADLPGVVYQIGKVRSRGVEAGAQGEILPGWRVNGGYTYTKLKTLADTNPLIEGISFQPVIPAHQVKMFTNYAPVTGRFAGASVGGAMTWFSSTFGGTAAVRNAAGVVTTRSSIVRQGAYAVVDLRAGYKFNERIGVSVNVNNLFDRHYYSRISSTGRGNYYGTPRTVFATLRLTYP